MEIEVRLPGKGSSKSHGARPVLLIITMIQWIRTSRLSTKKSLYIRLSIKKSLSDLERAFARVGALVGDEARRLREALATFLALVGLVARVLRARECVCEREGGRERASGGSVPFFC